METIRLYGGSEFRMELPSPTMPIEELPRPKQAIIPLSDHPGTYCRSLVQRDETIFKGDKIAEDPHHRMTPIHSPVSGRVTDISPYRFSEGGNVQSIFIESDDQETWKTKPVPVENFTDLEPLHLINTIRDAGVRIIPFEALPEAQRDGSKVTPVRHFVVNGIEHGFASSIARRLLVERSGELADVAGLIRRMFSPEKIYLVIDENHHDVIEAIGGAGLEGAFQVVKLPAYYPLGHPHLLFKAIFNREIPCPGGKAIDMGVAFTNVDTALHALEAVRLGRPLTERYVTVCGEGIQTPKNLKVRIGSPISDLIEFCGGLKGKPGRIVLGGPLEGMAQFSLDRPILKDNRVLWVQPETRVITEDYRACINCGDCIDVCPVGLMPNFLGKYCEFCNYEAAALQFHLWTCIECGLCAHVCPSRRPLVQFFKLGKEELTMKENGNASE